MNGDVIVHRDAMNGEVHYDGLSLPKERKEADMPTPTPSVARPYRPLTIGTTARPRARPRCGQRRLQRAAGEEEEEAEQEVGVMNAKALSVIARVEAKLLARLRAGSGTE